MTIRRVQTIEEYEQCIELQKLVWDFEDRDLVPRRTLIVAQKHGGALLGAFDGSKVVGFVLSLASFHKGRFGQHSHMLAVLPGYRDRGIGRQLKLAQRDDALGRRVQVITWTFDPLEARNGNLNFNKLGAVAREYLEDVYGRSSSAYHSSLGTDRFLAEWWIRSARVESLLASGPPPVPLSCLPVINPAASRNGILESAEPVLDRQEPQLLVEIPPEIQALKQDDHLRAEDWRRKTRVLFRHYLPRGYIVTGLVAEKEQNFLRVFYLMERQERLSGQIPLD